MSDITKAQRDALNWLRERNGDGMFDIHGVALAAGQSAPVRRETWNRLRAMGLIEFYNPIGRGRGRLRLTAAGQSEARA